MLKPREMNIEDECDKTSQHSQIDLNEPTNDIYENVTPSSQKTVPDISYSNTVYTNIKKEESFESFNGVFTQQKPIKKSSSRILYTHVLENNSTERRVCECNKFTCAEWCKSHKGETSEYSIYSDFPITQERKSTTSLKMKSRQLKMDMSRKLFVQHSFCEGMNIQENDLKEQVCDI